MTHIMLDLETLGRKLGCAILSIGAVAFDPYKVEEEPIATFYRSVDLSSQLFAGFTIECETLEWWKQQSHDAQATLTIGTHPVKWVLEEFVKWFAENNGEQVWCHGATFDAPILAEAFDILAIKTPWHYGAVRDTRTLYDLAGFDPKTMPRIGTYHNALHDALFQTQCVQIAMKNLLRRNLVAQA